MKLYEVSEKDKDILNLDIFTLLEMDSISVEKKQDYLTQIGELIFQYFLSEKVEDALTKDQLVELMSKYPPNDQSNVEELVKEINKISPNAPKLLVDALIETKARLVFDHYKSMLQGYTQLAKEEKDPKKKKYFGEKRDNYTSKLDLVQSGDWVEIVTLT